MSIRPSQFPDERKKTSIYNFLLPELEKLKMRIVSNSASCGSTKTRGLKKVARTKFGAGDCYSELAANGGLGEKTELLGSSGPSGDVKVKDSETFRHFQMGCWEAGVLLKGKSVPSRATTRPAGFW